MSFRVALVAGLSLCAAAADLPPVLLGHHPPDGATGVPTNTSILFAVTPRLFGEELSFALFAGDSPVNSSATMAPFDARKLTPASPLQPSTRYRVVVTYGPEVLGNRYSFEFTTGTGADTTGPRVVRFDPASGSAGTGLQGRYTVWFDEAVQSVEGITLKDEQGFLRTLEGGRFTPDFRGVTLRPQASGNRAGAYLLAVDPVQVRDAAGNPGQGSRAEASYPNLIAASPLTVAAVFPRAGERDVPTNVGIQILFNRPVAYNVAANAIRLESEGSATTLTMSLFAGNRGVLLKPRVPLRPGQTYRLSVTDAVRDPSGIGAEPFTWEFTAGGGPDLEAVRNEGVPFLRDVPLNPAIGFRFNKPITGTPQLQGATFSSSDGPVTTGRVTLSDDNRGLTIRTEGALRPLTEYSLALPDVFDATGERLLYSEMRFDTGVSEDRVPPRIVAVQPAPGSAGAQPGSPIEIEFDEPVSLWAFPDAIRLTRGGEAIGSRVELSGRFVRLRPNATLAENTEYQLESRGAADYAGNLAEPATFRFVTCTAGARTPRRLVRTTPEAGALDVSTAAPVTFEFDRELSRVVPEGAVTATSDVRSSIPVKATVAGNVLTVAPAGTWPAGAAVSIAVSLPDSELVVSSTAISFLTRTGEDRTAPRVTATEPPPGSGIHTERPAVTLVFSEAIAPETVTKDSVLAFSGGRRAELKLRVAPDARSVTAVMPPDVEGLVTVHVVGAVMDAAGNAMEPFDAKFEVRGVRQTRFGRTLVQVRPQALSQILRDDSGITLIFGSPVSMSEVESRYPVFADSVPVKGRWAEQGDARVFRFEPDSPFPRGSEVTAGVEFSHDIRFRVAGSDSPGMYPLRITGIETGMQSGDFVEAEFDRDFTDPTGLLAILRWRQQGAEVVETRMTRVRPGVVRLTPVAALEPEGNYTLVLGPRAAGMSDSTWVHRSWSLRVTPALERQPVQRLHTYPLPNSTNVPMNASIAVGYSGEINGLSVLPETVQVRAGGSVLRGQFRVWVTGTGFTFTPYGILPPASRIEVTISGVEDMAGRVFSPYSFSFESGRQIDVEPPGIIATDSGEGTEVQPGQSVSVVFSEPVSPEILDAFRNRGFAVTGIGEGRLSDDLRVFTIALGESAPRGRALETSISDVRDGSGNVLQSVRVTALVALDRDTAPPQLSRMFPEDGATGMPRNLAITAVFTEPVSRTQTRVVRLLEGEREVSLEAASTAVASGVKVRPTSPLRARTEYTIVVEGARDHAGNAMQGRVVRKFTTSEEIDVQPPAIAWRYGSILPTNVPAAFEFSEPVVPLTVEGRVTMRQSGQRGRIIPAAGTLLQDGRTLRIDPRTGTEPGMFYELEVSSGVEDYAGNAVERAQQISYMAGHDADREAPVAVVSPADGTTDVPLLPQLEVTFNEPVRLMPGERFSLQLFQGARPVPITTALYAFVRPLVLLEPGTTYTIRVAGVSDPAGNQLPAFTTTFRTTESITPGTNSSFRVQSTEPVNGATDVALDAPIRFIFDRPVAAQGGRGIEVSSADAVIPGITSIRQNTITFTPRVPMPPLTAITAGLGFQAVRDLAGNRAQGSSFITFTTRAGSDSTPPRLLSASPEGGTILPPTKRVIALRFSEPVRGIGEGIRVLGGTSPLPQTQFTTGEDPSVLFVELEIPSDSVLTIASTAALRDLAGNAAEPFSLEYRTLPALEYFSAPHVISAAPTEHSTIPVGRTPVTLRFDRAMDASSVLTSVRVLQDGSGVSGATEMMDGNQAVRFIPDVAFSPGARIDIFVLTSARDPEGVPLPARYQTYFFAEGPRTSSALQVIHTSLAAGAALDQPIAVEFDRTLVRGTAHSGTVWLQAAGTGHRIAGDVSTEEGNVLVVAPREKLAQGEEYKLVVSRGVQAEDGATFAGREFPFRAELASVKPAVEAVRLEQGWIRVRFARARNPLEAHRARLQRADGSAVHFNVRYSVGYDEWTLVPTAPESWASGWRILLPEGAVIPIAP